MTVSWEPDLPSICRLKLRGRLKESWSDWFGGMTIDFDVDAEGRPVTTMTGRIADRSALYGLLNKIRDLGLLVLSLELVDPEEE